MFLRSDLDIQLFQISKEFGDAAVDQRTKLKNEIAAGTTPEVNHNKNKKIEVLNKIISIVGEIKKVTRPTDPKTMKPLEVENRRLSHAQYVELNQLQGFAQRLQDCLQQAKDILPVGPVSTLVVKQSVTTALINDYIDNLAAVLPALKIDGVKDFTVHQNELLTQVKEALDKFLDDADPQLIDLKEEKDSAEKAGKQPVITNKSQKVDLLTKAIEAAGQMQAKTIEALNDYDQDSFQDGFVTPYRTLLDCEHKLKEVPSIGMFSFLQSSKSSSLVTELVGKISNIIPQIPGVSMDNEQKRPQI
jgi:hypothetical protein